MNLKVVSVDDSTTITTHLNYLFNKLDEIEWVAHAYDLSEGKKIIKSHKPDVILLDIMVQEESGFDLLLFVKKNFPCIKVYMLSNLNDEIYIKKSKQLGAAHFIDKSYEFETIAHLLMNEHKLKNNLIN